MARRTEEPGKKERTHERIVTEAAAALRRAGYDGISVAEVMREAGLTHGGFYAHFASREALVAEAVAHATASSGDALEAMVRSPTVDAEAGLPSLAAHYLSDAHTKKAEAGCTLAALASETRRQPRAVRAIASRNVDRFAAAVEAMLPERASNDARRDEALVVVAALVGALVLGRAVDDAPLSKRLREATRRFVAAKAI